MASDLVPLTSQEDTFALAVLEYGGNLAAAYRAAFGPDAKSPVANARLLISKPEVAMRINQLTELTQEHALISLGSHLQVLAELRDKSADIGDMATALKAEVQRGTVAGFYDKVGRDSDEKKPSVHIHFGKSSVTVEEWGAKNGVAPVIIDMPK